MAMSVSGVTKELRSYGGYIRRTHWVRFWMQALFWDCHSLFVVHYDSGLPKQRLAARVGIWKTALDEPYRRTTIYRGVRATVP
jgi:hypothetical protein